MKILKIQHVHMISDRGVSEGCSKVDGSGVWIKAKPKSWAQTKYSQFTNQSISFTSTGLVLIMPSTKREVRAKIGWRIYSRRSVACLIIPLNLMFCQVWLTRWSQVLPPHPESVTITSCLAQSPALVPAKPKCQQSKVVLHHRRSLPIDDWFNPLPRMSSTCGWSEYCHSHDGENARVL